MSKFERLIVRDHFELADALAKLKNFRGISNENLEELCGLTRGHCSKIIGVKPKKTIGKAVLPHLLKTLAGRLVLEADPEQELLMRSRWEKRNHQQVRVYAHPVSITVLRAVTPVIFAELSRKAALARMQKLSREERSRIAKRAAKARWKAIG